MADINGTANGETLIGTDDADTIDGGDGADIIYGRGGDDVLRAGAEATHQGFPILKIDFVYGEDGNDTLYGNGRDTLDGGAGDDALYLAPSLGATDGFAFGGDGNDRIEARTGRAVVDGGAGADTIFVSGIRGIEVDTPSIFATVTTGAGADLVEAEGRVVITDFESVGSQADGLVLTRYLAISAGNSLPHPGSNPFDWDDGLMLFQDGTDAVIRSLTNSFDIRENAFALLDVRLKNVDASLLTATHFGGFDPGALWIAGTAGNNALNGTNGADSLNGLEGDDTIDGGAGNDLVVGAQGADILTGGGGADRFLYTDIAQLASGERITDFESGVDKILISHLKSANVFLASNGTTSAVYVFADNQPALAGAGALNRVALSSVALASDIVLTPGDVFPSSLTMAIGGTEQADTIAGDASANAIFAMGGNDSVLGNGGDDLVFGEDGDDTLNGGAGDDDLFGGLGDDILYGNAGADDLAGGAGADRFIYLAGSESTSAAMDQILDFETGIDKLDLAGMTADVIALVRTNSVKTTIFATTPDGLFQTGTVAASGMGNLQGSDLITTKGIDLVGFDDPGVETLSGTNFADRIFGLGGRDTLMGRDGDDVLVGGANADTMTGGAGRDTFLFSAASESTANASDTIQDFESGLDTMDIAAIAPSAISLVRANATDTIVFASTPAGVFQAYLKSTAANLAIQGSDLLTGGRGVDIIGHAGDETQSGTAFADRLFGGNGNDTLRGQGGDDILHGQAGADLLYGGAGSDTFKYYAASESSAALYDTIKDFETGLDKIDIAELGATAVSVVRSGADSFIFAATPGGTFQLAVNGAVQGGDLLIGSLGIDMVGTAADEGLTGTPFADRLFGGGGFDTLGGGAGNDQIYGGAGRDLMTGGAGADSFVYQAAADSTGADFDIITDFQTGLDRIDLRGTGITSVGIARQGADYFIFGTGTGLPTLMIGVQQEVKLTDILTGLAGSGDIAATDAASAASSPALDDGFGLTGDLWHGGLVVAFGSDAHQDYIV